MGYIPFPPPPPLHAAAGGEEQGENRRSRGAAGALEGGLRRLPCLLPATSASHHSLAFIFQREQ